MTRPIEALTDKHLWEPTVSLVKGMAALTGDPDVREVLMARMVCDLAGEFPLVGIHPEKVALACEKAAAELRERIEEWEAGGERSANHDQPPRA